MLSKDAQSYQLYLVYERNVALFLYQQLCMDKIKGLYEMNASKSHDGYIMRH